MCMGRALSGLFDGPQLEALLGPVNTSSGDKIYPHFLNLPPSQLTALRVLSTEPLPFLPLPTTRKLCPCTHAGPSLFQEEAWSLI